MTHEASSGRSSGTRRPLGRCAAVTVVAALALSAAPAGAAPGRTARARAATRYVAANQAGHGSVTGGFSKMGTTADAVAAWVAARRGPRQIRRAVGWLEANVDDATTVGLKAKVLLAAVAAGKDPRTFAGHHDLVQEVEDTQTEEGQYGGESDTEVAYHALAMIALEAAGENVPPEAVTWLNDAQCGDGGWQFDEPSSDADDEHCFDSAAENDFARSDTNTTAYAVMALAAAGGQRPPADPFAFFEEARDLYRKGWVYEPHGKCDEQSLGKEFCYLTDANSTSLVIQAHVADGRAIPRGGDRGLAKLQYRLCGKRSGAFAFSWTYDPETGRFRKDAANVGATTAAIPALVHQALPVPEREVTKRPPRRRACR